ncbi:MAG: family 78 glycoside hydrolase catalytic domain [Pseudomonadota bacterium]
MGELMLRGSAEFIWTPKQAIVPRAMFGGVVQGKRREHPLNRWFYFRRSFQLRTVPASACAQITVDGRYQLFVNGRRVGRGPARCSPLAQRYDEYDLAPDLRPGENALAVLIRVYGEDMSWYETVKGLWRPVFGDGGLFFCSDLETTAGRLRSDTRWRCMQSAAWREDTPAANHGLGRIEVLDARLQPLDWTSPGFDDGHWDHAHPLVAGGGGPEAFFGGMEARPFPVLKPNEIGPLKETLLSPQRVVWAKRVAVNADLPVEDQLYQEAFLADLGTDPASPVLSDGETEGYSITTLPGEGVSLLLDFGRITTIFPHLELTGTGGEEVDVAVCERLPGEFTADGPLATARIARNELLGLDAHLSRYVARAGRQTFERFEWQAARWMQITVRNAPDGLTLHKVAGRFVTFDAEPRGNFRCSDEFLTRLWATGLYTLQLCMHDGWEDCPSREQRQWLGDATVENLVGHIAVGPATARLNREYLRKAAESQRADGLTQMFAPGNHGENGLLIPDWTLQWILNAQDHYAWTGETDVIEEIFPAIERALAWFDNVSNEAGLVENMPYWHFMDWAGLGRAGTATTLNAQLAGCFDAAARLAVAVQRDALATRYKQRRDSIRAELNDSHWDDARGVYVDGVDPRSGVRSNRVSQHANAAMILWGAAPASRWGRMIEYVCDPKRIRFTAAPPIAPAGEVFDELSDVVMTNTFYSHFLYEALAHAGRSDLMLKLVHTRYGPMLDRGATTLWESFEPTASLCHGFSASPTWQLSTKVLGVSRDPQARERLIMKPDLVGMDHAEGLVPLREGDVEVVIRRTGDQTTAEFVVPASVSYQVQSAPGLRLLDVQDGLSSKDRTRVVVNYTSTESQR